MFFLREGVERNKGRVKPEDNLDPQKVGGGTDPSRGMRQKTTIRCNGYTDPETGRNVVAPGHKVREIVFTQDASQTTRCDACQKAYRNRYKINNRRKRMGNPSGAGPPSSGRPF